MSCIPITQAGIILFHIVDTDSPRKAKSCSHVRLFATPWTVAYQGPLSVGFSRQEYWSGLPFPTQWPVKAQVKERAAHLSL